jgi:hypothetical protein
MSSPLGVGGAGVAGVHIPSIAARAASRRVGLENDGLVCFLYDEQHAGTIARSNPKLLESFDAAQSVEDPAMRDLALRGALLAYELYRDDPISVEIDIGPLIGARDLRSGRWLPPQSGYMDLPTGRLRLDSYASLPLGRRIPSAVGAVVRVPPGRYVVTLLRFDWYGQRMFPSMFDDAPSEFLRLTPVGQSRLPSRPRPMLLYPAPPIEAWEGEWEVSDGTFRGKLVGDVGALNSLAVNIDRDAAARLGLSAGMRLRAEAGRHTFEALYAGDVRIDEIVERHGSYTLGELRAAAPFLAWMDHWQRPRRRMPSTVVLLSGGPTASYDFSGLREGQSVAITVDRRSAEPLPWTSGRSAGALSR